MSSPGYISKCYDNIMHTCVVLLALNLRLPFSIKDFADFAIVLFIIQFCRVIQFQLVELVTEHWLKAEEAVQ